MTCGGIITRPHHSETIGIAAWEGRGANEGTSVPLLLPGLDEKWRADSMECYCCSRSVQGLFSDGKTSQERRFGEPFSVPTKPFRSMIENHPTSAKTREFSLRVRKRRFPQGSGRRISQQSERRSAQGSERRSFLASLLATLFVLGETGEGIYSSQKLGNYWKMKLQKHVSKDSTQKKFS